jgi:hypothetical protein
MNLPDACSGVYVKEAVLKGISTIKIIFVYSCSNG